MAEGNAQIEQKLDGLDGGEATDRSAAEHQVQYVVLLTQHQDKTLLCLSGTDEDLVSNIPSHRIAIPPRMFIFLD
jgi:hypothetical protein